MGGDVTIETERLVLRGFHRDDWESVHEYAVDPDVYVQVYIPEMTRRLAGFQSA